MLIVSRTQFGCLMHIGAQKSLNLLKLSIKLDLNYCLSTFPLERRLDFGYCVSLHFSVSWTFCVFSLTHSMLAYINDLWTKVMSEKTGKTKPLVFNEALWKVYAPYTIAGYPIIVGLQPVKPTIIALLFIFLLENQMVLFSWSSYTPCCIAVTGFSFMWSRWLILKNLFSWCERFTALKTHLRIFAVG